MSADPDTRADTRADTHRPLRQDGEQSRERLLRAGLAEPGNARIRWESIRDHAA